MQNPMTGPLATPSTEMMNRMLERFQSSVRSSGSSASGQNKEELKKVAHEFESLFVGYLLKVMRETIEEADSGEGGYGKTVYTELFDEEMSKSIAKQGIFGIADILIKRLSSESPVSPGLAGELKSEKLSTPVQPQPAPQPSVPESKPDLDPEISDISDIHLPVRAPVSSRFGMRKDPFTRQLRFHKGMDLAAPEGTEVRAACEGEVVFAGFKSGYGNTVIVQRPGGLETTYAHLGEVHVRKGDTIAAEQILGLVGNTGHSTGPHLHFEVSRWGEPMDPRAALTE